ncbi:MAG: AI-2E family transporter, partial [Actinobacteria bacterium]|nr:AI-2E family transporter [Actinomycetota bacterium]
LTFVVYSIANQWTALSVQFTDGLQRIVTWLESGNLPFTVTNQQIAVWISSAESWLQDNAGQLAGQVAAGASSAVEVFTCLALAIFCTVFFLARGSQIWTWFLNQLPARGRGNVDEAAGIGWYTFSGYTRGTMLIAATDSILAFIALEIIRVPLAAPLAVLVFIGAFIPLIGAPLAMVIAMVVALATLGPVQAAVVGLCIAGIGQFEGHILQPMVMGKQVSLHPVVVALTVTAGTLTAGILGAVISVPLVAVAWAIFSKMRTMDPPLDDGDDEADVVGPDDETAHDGVTAQA